MRHGSQTEGERKGGQTGAEGRGKVIGECKIRRNMQL